VLAGMSDLIVVGTIVEVSPKTFTLKVEEVLAGDERSNEIEVLQSKIGPAPSAGNPTRSASERRRGMGDHRRRGFLQTEGLADLLGSRACSLSVAVQGPRLSRVHCAR
jgi:hypothetical protein